MSAPDDPLKATRRLYFVKLSRAGITTTYRKRWQQENGFPESTQDWKQQDYDRALKVLASLEPIPEEEA